MYDFFYSKNELYDYNAGEILVREMTANTEMDPTTSQLQRVTKMFNTNNYAGSIFTK